MGLLTNLKARLAIFLGVLGPGIITAIADNDAGGVATYSILGAKFGYSILFLLLLVAILLAITQEMGARIAIVTGQGLGDLVREHFGIRISLLVFSVLVVANLGATVANFAGLTAVLSLFGVPTLPYLILFVLLMVVFISQGSYQTNQKIFLIGSLLYVAYVISAILARPDWHFALQSLVAPTNVRPSLDFMFGAIALLGTTVTPWGQFFVSSFIVDKKLTPDKLRYEQLEVYIGAFLTAFFSFFMIVAVAATLFVSGIQIASAPDAALAIVPFAGQFASLLFGVGLLVASYMGAVIIPLTTAYAFSEFFGYEGSLDLPFNQSRNFYILFLAQVFVAALIVFIPKVSLFQIVLFTQSLNGILLPVIIFFLLKFANDRAIMGQHTNGLFQNVFAGISAVAIVISSVVVVAGGLFGKIA